MNNTDTINTQSTGLSPGIILLFAITGGLAVGNLYWAQPLLVDISKALNAPVSLISGLVTATQIGYALGILLIVPLGDSLNRKRLIPVIMLCSSVSLLFCALSPNFIALLSTLCFLGLTTVSGQLITPLASELADQQQKGKVVGTIISGMLTGILLSRSISGFLSEQLGWRAIYVIVCVCMFILAITMFRIIPEERKRESLSYFRLLRSVYSSVKKHKSAQVTLLIGSATFFTFSAFWTGLTFLLSSDPYNYSLSQIGMVGLIGVAGAMVARKAGTLHDKGHSYGGVITGLLFAITALIAVLVSSDSITILLLAILVLDIVFQMLNVLNQTRLLTIDPQARNRLNTAFVSCNFIGGALGSALTGFIWANSGWSALMIVCISVMLVAVSITVYNRKELNHNYFSSPS